MDSLIQNIEKDVQCSLCNDTLTEPKILKCSDTFCKLCIKRHAVPIEEANIFKCPKCKSETHLPELNSVEDLKPSVRHSKILEFLDFFMSEKFCSVCERKPKATWYCLDRQRLLCDDCAKTNSIINKEQQNISLTDLREADFKRILKRENLCQDHEQVYEFFCKDCEEFICIHCFRSRQCRAHGTVSMAEGSLLDLLAKEEQDKLKVREEEIQKNVEKHKEILLTTKKDGERAKAEIEETVKQLIDKLQKCKEQLDEHIEQRIEEAEQESKKDQEELVRIARALDYIAEMKKFGVVSEIRKATQNIEVYDHSSNIVTPNIQDGSRFKFVINDECFRFLHSKHGLGSLKQVDMTTAIHVDPELEALNEAKLTLTANKTSSEKHQGCACTSNGAVAPVKTTPVENESKEGEKHSKNGGTKDETLNAAVDDQRARAAVAAEEANHISQLTKPAQEKPIVGDLNDVVDVKISPEENVEKIEKYVRGDGQVEVEFVPKVAGQLKAEVQVNGNHVSNSPLVMNVMPQKMKIEREINAKTLDGKKPRFAGIAVNKESSRIAVTDWTTHSVNVLTIDGDLLLIYGGKGDEQGKLNCPHGLAFLNETDLVIADCNNHRICIVNTTTGILVKTFGNKGNENGDFNEPHGVQVDDDGNIIVCDTDNHRVQVFTREGDYRYQFGLQKVDHFSPIAVLKIQDQFFVSDFSNNVIHVFERKGSVVTRVATIGGEGGGDGQLSGPCGLAVDSDHHLLVCDNGNNRIQKVTLDGRLVGKTYEEIKNPYEIAVGKVGVLASTVSSKIFILK